MALNNVTSFLQAVKPQEVTDERLKEAMKLLYVKESSPKRYEDVSSEDFLNCVNKILANEKQEHVLNEDQLNEIKRQLQLCSVNGNIEEDIFVDLWKYWLRKETKRISAFIVVDMQNDFIDGSLAVPKGEEVIPVINNVFEKYSSKFDVVIYTRDWHPQKHISFFENYPSWPLHKSFQDKKDSIKMFDKVLFEIEEKAHPYEQVLWPTHCVQNTSGAELHKDLRKPQDSDIVFNKGAEEDSDYYSALWNSDHSKRTTLFNQLLQLNVTDVFVAGLAIDFCVGYTLTDIATQGFKLYFIEDGTRPIDPSGAVKMIETLKQLKVEIIQSSQIADYL